MDSYAYLDGGVDRLAEVTLAGNTKVKWAYDTAGAVRELAWSNDSTGGPSFLTQWAPAGSGTQSHGGLETVYLVEACFR